MTTNVDGNRELITDGETGWLVPPAAPAALADAILRVLEDPAAAARVGRAAARRMAAEFSVEKMVDGYDRLYRSLG